jgi:glycosyltransferase involved in cell wall biosynthesis
MQAQSRPADEILFVDDASSDSTAESARHLGFRVLVQSSRRGPGAARNLGVKSATGDIIAFIDADCQPAQDWLKKIEAILARRPHEVIMGATKIIQAGFLADAISDLGFPGGGNLGFEKVWHVDDCGYTDHISACNFAVTKVIFERAGGFDERINLSGCEDVELSLRWSRNGVKIRYHPEVKVWHLPRKEFCSFVRWHFSRGRGNYQFMRINKSVAYFVRLRFWYLGNLIRTFRTDPRLPILVFLLGVSFFTQIVGYLVQSWRHEPF